MGRARVSMRISVLVLPGTGEAPAAPVFIDGQKAMTLRGENIAEEFQQIVEGYVQEKYPQHESAEIEPVI